MCDCRGINSAVAVSADPDPEADFKPQCPLKNELKKSSWLLPWRRERWVVFLGFFFHFTAFNIWHCIAFSME